MIFDSKANFSILFCPTDDNKISKFVLFLFRYKSLILVGCWLFFYCLQFSYQPICYGIEISPPQYRKLKPISSSKIQIPLSQTFSAQSCSYRSETKNNDTWHNSGLTVHYFYTYFVLLVVYHRPTRMAYLCSLAHSTGNTTFPFFH